MKKTYLRGYLANLYMSDKLKQSREAPIDSAIITCLLNLSSAETASLETQYEVMQAEIAKLSFDFKNACLEFVRNIEKQTPTPEGTNPPA